MVASSIFAVVTAPDARSTVVTCPSSMPVDVTAPTLILSAVTAEAEISSVVTAELHRTASHHSTAVAWSRCTHPPLDSITCHRAGSQLVGSDRIVAQSVVHLAVMSSGGDI